MSTQDWNNGRKIEAKFRPYIQDYYKKYYDSWKYKDTKLFYENDVDLGAKKGKEVSLIEEKFINDVNGTYFMIMVEEIQNSNVNSLGWIHTSKAGELLYCWCCETKRQIRIIHLDFKMFKKWYNMVKNTFKLQKFETTDTKPIGRLIKLSDIPKPIIIRYVTLTY